MLPEKFAKILELIRKTGDRLILADPNDPDEAYALMSFDSYHDLVFGEDKSNNQGESGDGESKPEISSATSDSLPEKSEDKSKKDLTEEDLTDKINREISMWKNKDEAPYLGDKDSQPKKAWEISPKVKNKAEEVV